MKICFSLLIARFINRAFVSIAKVRDRSRPRLSCHCSCRRRLAVSLFASQGDSPESHDSEGVHRIRRRTRTLRSGLSSGPRHAESGSGGSSRPRIEGTDHLRLRVKAFVAFKGVDPWVVLK